MIGNFLENLKPFEAKIVIYPLTEEEVETIEKRINKKLPEYYKEFLLKVGLKQDAVWGLNNRIEDFEELKDFLPDGQHKRFFRFGDNKGEDYWLLRCDDPNDKTIYEYYYYADNNIQSIGKTFDDLLNESIQYLHENQSKLTDNSEKVWAVQFAVKTDNELKIIEALRDNFQCALSTPAIRTEISPEKVICSEGIMNLSGEEISLSKQEYDGWTSPLFYFDWKESIDEMIHDSKIKKIQKNLTDKGLKTTLIDYGIMKKY